MSYHFIGIGGIGMSALARILLERGKKVAGSDAKANAILKNLIKKGASAHVGHCEENLSTGTTVIYSSAVSKENVEYQKALKEKMALMHRSDLLTDLMKGYQSLLVTGTHGKTTTSALLASVLCDADIDPSFAIGGILTSLKTNGHHGKGNLFVAELDESDGSFLKAKGAVGIVTNCECDHMEYWKTEERLHQGFREFFTNVQTLFWCFDDPGLQKLQPKGISYGFSKDAELCATNVRQKKFQLIFDVSWRGQLYKDVEVPLIGKHNALNALAVFGLCLYLGLQEKSIREALCKFQGVQRRLECKEDAHSIQIYDDYAHHPTEISATLFALREAILEKRMVAIFQPHRFSRFQNFFEEFTHCFDKADLLIVTDVYGAGEDPIEGIDSLSFCKKVSGSIYIPREKLEEKLLSIVEPHDVVITLGAGDVTDVGSTFFDLYRKNPKSLTIALLYGGKSLEHEIAKISANFIRDNLDPKLYKVKPFLIDKKGKWHCSEAFEKNPFAALEECDVCFPIFHGPNGEDGMIQGFLETLQIPYVGADFRSSAVCMHKEWTKLLVNSHGVPTLDFIELAENQWRDKREELIKEITLEMKYPVFIKPSHYGSSIGVSKVVAKEDLCLAIDRAFLYDNHLIIEKAVDCREIEIAVMGNEYIQVATPGEILTEGQFYDYEKKYGENAIPTKVPADLPEHLVIKAQTLAKKVYQALCCSGYARIDFFLVGEKFYLNEINPIPGLTSISLFPKMWENDGLSGPALINWLIILALHRKRQNASKKI